MSDAVMSSCWQPVDQTLVGLERDCQEFAQQVDQMLDEIDCLRRAVLEKSEQLEGERRKLAQRESELTEQRSENARITLQLERQEAQLSETLTIVKELRQSNPLDSPAASDEQVVPRAEQQLETTTTMESDATAGDSADDATLKSVAAQFAKLQKDVTGRRKKKKRK